MRKSLSCLIALALAAPLAACGQAAPTGFAAKRQATQLKRQSAEPASLARRFADAMRAGFKGRVVHDGVLVALEDDDLTIAYDFTGADQTGRVKVTSEDFETTLALEALMGGAGGEARTEALPVLLIPIATQVAIAGAKALAVYYLMHRGENFDKGDAVKATVVAMSLALVPFVGQMGVVGQFVPLAGKLVASAGSFAFKDLAVSAIGMLDEIVPLVIMLIKSRKAKETAWNRS